MFCKAKVISDPCCRTFFFFLLRNIYFVVFSFLVIAEVLRMCDIAGTDLGSYVDYRQKQILRLTL